MSVPTIMGFSGVTGGDEETPAPHGAKPMQDEQDDSFTTPVGTDNYTQQEDVDDPEGAAEEDYENALPINWDDTVGPDGKGKLDTEKLKEVADDIFVLIRDGYDAIKDGGRHRSIDRWRDIYETKANLREGPWPNSSKIQPPDVRTAVETTTAYQHKMLTGGKYWIRVTPDIDTDKEVATKLQDFFMHEMASSRGNFAYKFGQGLSTANVDGQVVCVTDWTRRTAKRRQRIVVNENFIRKLQAGGKDVAMPDDPDTFPMITIDGKQYRWGEKYIYESDDVVENHFGYQFIVSQDFVMFPPTSPTIDDASLVGYFYGKSLADIKKLARDNVFDEEQVDVLESLSPRAMGTDDDSIESGTLGGSVRAKRSQQVDDADSTAVDKYGQLRMFCGIFKGYDVDGDGYTEPVLVQMECSTRTILTFQSLPFDNGKINMKEVRPEPRVGGGFWGYSQVEKQEELNKEITALTRMGIDLATLSACIYAAVKPGRRKVSDIAQRPGITFMDTEEDGELVDFKQVNALPASILPVREGVRQMIQGVANAGSLLQGGNAGPEQTNQQTNLAVTSSGVRMRMQLICLLDYITWFANQFFDYNIQYQEDAVNFTVKRNGKDIPMSVGLADLTIPCRIEAYCADLEPDVALRHQFAEKIFTSMAQSPFAQQDMARLWQILSDFVGEMGFDDELGPRIGSLDEAQKQQEATVQQQQAEAAQQQQLMGGLQRLAAMQGGQPPQSGQPPQQGQAPAPNGANNQGLPAQGVAELIHHIISNLGNRPQGGQNGN